MWWGLGVGAGPLTEQAAWFGRIPKLRLLTCSPIRSHVQSLQIREDYKDTCTPLAENSGSYCPVCTKGFIFPKNCDYAVNSTITLHYILETTS